MNERKAYLVQPRNYKDISGYVTRETVIAHTIKELEETINKKWPQTEVDILACALSSVYER